MSNLNLSCQNLINHVTPLFTIITCSNLVLYGNKLSKYFWYFTKCKNKWEGKVLHYWPKPNLISINIYSKSHIYRPQIKIYKSHVSCFKWLKKIHLEMSINSESCCISLYQVNILILICDYRSNSCQTWERDSA